MTVSADVLDVEIPDLSDPATFERGVPWEAFAAMRKMPGLYWQPTTVATQHGGFWAVTRLADIQAIERDWKTFSSVYGASYPVMTPEPVEGPTANSLIVTDPDRHTRLRRVAAKGFAPRVVANFDPWVREIVRATIARATEKGEEFDFIQEFARTIPAHVMAKVIGVPPEDWPVIVDFASAVFAATQQTDGLGPGEGTWERVTEELGKIAVYSETLRAIKREHPADDMATVISRCVDEGEINFDEFVGWIQQLIAAGFETTHTAIAHSMRMYLEDSEVQQATDRALDEGQIANAVDEYVRMISPPMQMARTVTRDIEICGEQMRRGDVVVLYFIAANRDETVFSEPDRFDPWRPEKRSIAFGSGVHSCIGAHLARLELRILWEELRAADFRLRLNGTPRRGPSNMVNQLIELPVARI